MTHLKHNCFIWAGAIHPDIARLNQPPAWHKARNHVPPLRPTSSDNPEAITTKVRRPIRGE